MRIRLLGALLAILTFGLAASTRSQNSDTLQALKNSLSPDQQNSIMQNILGKGGTSGKKSDAPLESPETIRRKNGETTDLLDKERNQKSLDGRMLRQFDEDPELRGDDTVLIELITQDELCSGEIKQPNEQNN